MLVIKNICKQFNDKLILDNVSFSLKKGSIGVLLGESGVGKSTLLRVLSNLETKDSGAVELDSKELELSQVHKTHTVGMVFQQFNLFEHLTVEENITLALEKVANKTVAQAKEIAAHLLKKYGLADKAHVYPHRLSGGQKQRLAIARTIALKPTIVCMDEPTSALDPLLTTHVANAIMQLAQEGYIVLVASHDTTLLEKLDCTIFLMDRGMIVQTAQATDFYKNKHQYPLINQFVAGIIQT